MSARSSGVREEPLHMMRGAEVARMIAAGMVSVALVLDPSVSARADEPCARVVTPTTLSDAWAEAVALLRKQIAQLPVSDCRTMTLSLELQEAGMRIVALTGDGRRAERMVVRSEGLVATALGLLMTIPEALPPVPATSPASATPFVSEARPATLTAIPTSNVAPRAIALWAGLSGGLRLMAPTSLSTLDVEARADILFDRWFMLVTLGSALVSCLGQQGVDCDAYNDVSFGAGVGRRYRASGSDIDFAFEPSVVVMHMEYDGPSGAEGQDVQGTEVVLRFDVSARLAIP